MKFLYVADTHLGSDKRGYQQQKKYPEQLPTILKALGAYVDTNDDIDFVLHGGDMIESTTDENILAAIKAFDLSVPVYLCLGNHDLTESTAVDKWLELAPNFFIDSDPCYSIRSEDCIIHVSPSHWGVKQFFLDNVQNPSFSSEQMEFFHRELSLTPGLPHIILTHSPIFGLPVEQIGLSEPDHSPNSSFTEQMTGIVEKHKSVSCVLGAHNHMNMRIDYEGVEFITVSSLIEAPFEFKVFEVTPSRIAMSTVALSSLDFDVEYDIDKSFVQGRHVDREFARRLRDTK